MKLRNLKYLPRVRHITLVFFEEGFGFLIKRARLQHHIPFTKRIEEALRKKGDRWKPEVNLRHALERLGPTFIKFGQMLSLRPDVLPFEYITELEKMQDRAPTVSYTEIVKTIETVFGKSIRQIFASFEKKPRAAASLAQVHKAKLKTGEVVAVKILRPNIDHIVKEDMEVLTSVAHWLEKHRILPQVPLVGLVEEFKRWTLRELNLHYEATNAKLFRENFKGSKDVIIPKVYDKYCTEHVLTAEFIEGIPLHDIEKVKKIDGKMIIFKAYKALIDMILIHGLFHGDPHPGNILIVKKQVAFVDFGIVGKVDEKLRPIILTFMTSVLENDADRAVEALLELRTNNDLVDRSKVRRDFSEILDEIKYEELKDVNVGQLLRQTLELINHHKIIPPVDFVLFAKAVITLEGLGLRYNPNFKLLAETQPMISDIIKRESSPGVILKRLRQQANTYRSILEKTPNHIANIIERLSQGKIEVEVVPREFYEFRTEIEHGAGNIAIGLFTSSIVVASALIMRMGKEEIFGMPKLSFMGFLFSGILGLWLIRRTLLKKHKGGEEE